MAVAMLRKEKTQIPLLDGGIHTIESVFPTELMDRLADFTDRTPWQYGWNSRRGSGHHHWHQDYAPGRGDNGLDQADEIPPVIGECWRYLQEHYFGAKALLRCYINAHTYGIEGYPHTDSRRSGDTTFVVYVNRKWQREWGGETAVYTDDNIETSSLPKYNRGFLFPGERWHAARSVSRNCPELRQTVIFKFSDHHADMLRDRIQVLLEVRGADKIKHSSNNLQGHLLRTYDRLRQAGHDPITCAAGGLHSIYGTNAFTNSILSLDDEQLVINTVGPHAAELVRLFHSIDRPATLRETMAGSTTKTRLRDGSLIDVEPKKLNSLYAIEAANLEDQKSRSKFPTLQALAKTRTAKNETQK